MPLSSMDFPEKLRMLLEERDLTQKRLAAELKIPPSTLGGYVQGTSEPDFATLRELCRYFGVSADYLLDLPEGPARAEDQRELLRVFRGLTADQRELYLEQGRAILKVNARAAGGASKTDAKGPE